MATPPHRLVKIRTSDNGKDFWCLESTLVNGSAYFRALFKGGFAEGGRGGLEDSSDSNPNPNPTYFVEIDSDVFKILLHRIRYPEVILPKTLIQQTVGLREAADFLGVDIEIKEEPEEEPAARQLQIIERLQAGDVFVCKGSSDTFRYYDPKTTYFRSTDGCFTWGYLGRNISVLNETAILQRPVQQKRPLWWEGE